MKQYAIANLKKIPKFHTKSQIREEEYRKIILIDTLEIHIIELPKLIKQLSENKGNKKDKLALWSMFILNPENIREEDMKENEDLRLAKQELEKLKQDEHERYMAELRMKHIRDSQAIEDYGFDRGLEQGIKQGIEKGKEELKNKQLEIARKLLDLKMPVEQIIEITGLTEDEIKSI